jgi:hypothetical protein
MATLIESGDAQATPANPERARNPTAASAVRYPVIGFIHASCPREIAQCHVYPALDTIDLQADTPLKSGTCAIVVDMDQSGLIIFHR